MVHVHFVDDGEVKVLLDDRMRNVRGQFRVSMHHGHGPGAPAFVSGLKLRGGANGKGGDEVQAEGRGMVVVDQENHIGRVVLEPLLGVFVTLEHRLPIRLSGFAQVQRGANGRHVRGVNGSGDVCHGQAFAFWPARPWGCRWAWASPSSPTTRLPLAERPPATIMLRYSSSVMPVMLPAIC